jgi:hypothetical protein
MDMPQITHFIKHSNESLLHSLNKKSTGAYRKNFFLAFKVLVKLHKLAF